MARSLVSEVLFNDDEDRSVFLSLFGKYLDLVDYRCYAWALMSNHYHLVVRTSDQDLWGLMKPLNTSYARYHKKKHKRDGPPFRDRYKSIVTQDQNYIEELVRYVHLNPIRAGVCKDLDALDSYPWSGHSVLMGRKKRLFQDCEKVLRRFGNDNKNARIAYRAFLQEGLDKDENADVLVKLVRDSNKGKELGRHAGCWVIGDDDFVKNVLADAEDSRLRISRFEKEGRNLDEIAEKVDLKFQVLIETLKRRCRGGIGADARKILVYSAIVQFRAPSRIVAEYCGVGLAAVSAMAREGAIFAKIYNFTI
ncbi:MAG TPA: transposase [Chitinispirillaceae bacterium]|nr:transposase [Chitinispirillaceae bacterium]